MHWSTSSLIWPDIPVLNFFDHTELSVNPPKERNKGVCAHWKNCGNLKVKERQQNDPTWAELYTFTSCKAHTNCEYIALFLATIESSTYIQDSFEIRANQKPQTRLRKSTLKHSKGNYITVFLLLNNRKPDTIIATAQLLQGNNKVIYFQSTVHFICPCSIRQDTDFV